MLPRLVSAGTALAAASALTGCVSYFEAPADLASTAAAIAGRTGGRFTFPEAVALAFEQNPTLVALAARARAAGAVTVPIEVQSEWRSDTEMLSVMVDPVALLGWGPRGGALGVAKAEAEAAVQELATGRWQVAAAIAEGFAVDGALAGLDVPPIDVPVDAFEQAGLAGPLAAAQVRSAMARAEAERVELQNARESNLAEVRALLGLPARAALELVPGGAIVAPATEAGLLQRPDLALAAAKFGLADAEFRAAVADQYPTLMVGPEIPLKGDPLQAMAVLRLPIGMHGRAAAAGERREAARAELAAAYLAASREAGNAARERETASAQAKAAAASQQASAVALRTSLVGADVEPDAMAFERIAEAAGMVVRETMERRVASVGAARAGVRAAVACGWPAGEEVR
jgi:hypothetical protein